MGFLSMAFSSSHYPTHRRPNMERAVPTFSPRRRGKSGVAGIGECPRVWEGGTVGLGGLCCFLPRALYSSWWVSAGLVAFVLPRDRLRAYRE